MACLDQYKNCDQTASKEILQEESFQALQDQTIYSHFSTSTTFDSFALRTVPVLR